MADTRENLVSKLKAILDRYNTVQDIQYEMDTYEPEDHYKRTVQVPPFPGDFASEQERELWTNRPDHEAENALEVIEQNYRAVYALKEPQPPQKTTFLEIRDERLEAKGSKLGCMAYAALGISAFFIVGSFVGVDESTADTLPTIYTIAAVAAAAFVILMILKGMIKAKVDQKVARELTEYQLHQEAVMEEYHEKRRAYERESAAYELRLKAFMEAYAPWRENYIESRREEAEIRERLENDRQAAVVKIFTEQLIPAKAALNRENDLVPEEYLPVLKVLIDLLRSRRADDLKEAINLYEDLVYRERQLELQREIEENRQLEASQRREDEERRHQEALEQRDRQERDRQYQQRRWEEEERNRAEKAERERQAREDRATRSQCGACAHAKHCRVVYRTPNCSGFSPR